MKASTIDSDRSRHGAARPVQQRRSLKPRQFKRRPQVGLLRPKPQQRAGALLADRASSRRKFCRTSGSRSACSRPRPVKSPSPDIGRTQPTFR